MIEGNPVLERWLNRLIENETLPESSAPKSAMSAINNLIDLEYISKKPVKNGIIFEILDRNELLKWTERIIRISKSDNSTLDRGAAALRYRSSKKSSKTYPKVEIKFIVQSENIPMEFTQFQNQVGTMNYYYEQGKSIIQGEVVLIENLESFLKADKLFPKHDIAVYYRGNIAESLILHLTDSNCNILFFPDYDPVGIQNYCRVKDALGKKVNLFIPENLNEIFESSSFQIIEKQKNRKLLSELTKRKVPEEVIPIIKLIQKHHAGAEQELLHNYFLD